MLSQYNKYVNDRKKIYNHFDLLSRNNPWYLQISRSYSLKYTLAKGIYRRAKIHYYINMNLVNRFNTYIFNQEVFPYGVFLFGTSTVAKTGCAAVALFNVLFKLGYTTHLAQIILEMELNCMLDNNGANGTKNPEISPFLRAHSIRYIYYNQFSNFKKDLNKYRISLVFVDNHFFCVIKIGKNYYTLNYKTDDKDYSQIDYTSIKKKFICAYCIK